MSTSDSPNDALPAFVVRGEWVGPDRGKNFAPPRSHPYGLDAWQVVVNGEVRIYPNREAANQEGRG